MPGVLGHEVAGETRAAARLRVLPVVVVSGSWLRGDVASAYELSVAAHVGKNALIDSEDTTFEDLVIGFNRSPRSSVVVFTAFFGLS